MAERRTKKQKTLNNPDFKCIQLLCNQQNKQTHGFRSNLLGHTHMLLVFQFHIVFCDLAGVSVVIMDSYTKKVIAQAGVTLNRLGHKPL
uniref:Uncharacterized protein n=1 Tax=Arion vulgaris TaxID=1028688 RepID=A0A0B7BFF6_9EUPU